MAAVQPKATSSPRRGRSPSAMPLDTVEVSRNSGLNKSVGTFGLSNRFSDKLAGRGISSPNGRDFYKNNALFKNAMEEGLTCGFGIGNRPSMTLKVPRNVGPGSYEIIASAAHTKSPLDGPEYCSTTMHGKLPSKLVPVDMCSPGPHHKYEVRKPLDHHLPKFGTESLSRGGRHHFSEDVDQPGPGQYAVTYHKSVASVASAPDLSSTAPPKLRTVKSTFGIADRFKAQRMTSSPKDQYFYAHSKQWDKEDYIANCRACTLGKGQRTDFANPLRGPVFQVSPVSYSPVASTAYPTSALDGLTKRLQSPIAAACKSLAASAKAQRAGHGFPGSTGKAGGGRDGAGGASEARGGAA